MRKHNFFAFILTLFMLVALTACGSGETIPDEESAPSAVEHADREDGHNDSSAGTPADPPPEAADIPAGKMIDYLWSQLKGTWEFEEFIYMGKTTQYGDEDHTMEFLYVDKVPCMRKYTQRDDVHYADEVFFEADIIDEFHYDAYIYKKGSYENEGANWGDDALRAWWSFDLRNLSNGELLMTYNVAFDGGFIDDANTFKYTCASAQQTPLTVSENDDQDAQDVLAGDFSCFSGNYAPYSIFQADFGAVPLSEAGITLNEDGIVNGGKPYGWHSGGKLETIENSYAGIKPISITKTEEGAFVCMISEGEQEYDEQSEIMFQVKPREFFIVCPAGVTSAYENYLSRDDLGIDSIRIRYILIDGGISDIMYYKEEP